VYHTCCLFSFLGLARSSIKVVNSFLVALNLLNIWSMAERNLLDTSGHIVCIYICITLRLGSDCRSICLPKIILFDG